MRFYLIRHGATRGNKEHRYVGCTDEGVLEEEIDRMREKGQSLPRMDGIFVSPYLRCRQSAYALFSIFQYQDYRKLNQTKELNDIFQVKGKIEIVEDFKEMNFGAFEYKNYQELNKNADYQKFIDSVGKTGFPEGESLQKFQLRCQEAFLKCVKKAKENQWKTVAFVVHGGTIMAILEAFGYPKKEYYDYQVPNGCGYIVQLEEKIKKDIAKNREKDNKRNIEKDNKKNIEKNSKRDVEENNKRNIEKNSKRNVEENNKRNIEEFIEKKGKKLEEEIIEYERKYLLRIEEEIK